MKQIFYAPPLREQSGLAVVGQGIDALPAQGTLTHVSDIGGVSTYKLEPGETGAWVMAVAGEVKALAGARVEVAKTIGQKTVSLVVLGPQAVIEHIGRGRRASRIAVYLAGAEVDIPVSVLVSAGILQSGSEAQDVQQPPELPADLAAAFAALTGTARPAASIEPPREKRKYNKRK